MKQYLLLFCIADLLFSCTPQLETNRFTTIVSLIDEGKELHKPSLIYLSMPECMMCELLDYKIFKEELVQDYLSDHFLFYKIDITENLFFNRLFYFYGAPILIIIEDEEIRTIISEADEVDEFLFALKNYKMTALASTLAPYTNLQGNDMFIARTINEMLGVLYHQEKGDQPTGKIMEWLTRSVENYPCFYNQYLLAQTCRMSQPEKAEEIESRLMNHTDGLVSMLFFREIEQMWNKQFHLNGNVKSEIEFGHLKYDFGEVKQNEVVVHQFPFRNISSVPLLIYSVNASCGCTVPKWKQQPILPHAADSLEVKFTASSLGNNTKSIHVISNGEKRNTILTITASVK